MHRGEKEGVKMKRVLFSGVHGVGKGFFLDKVKKYIEDYNIYSASSLIEKYQPSTDAGYKKVGNVNNNQDVLIKAIKRANREDEKSYILDGHLCLFNAKGEVVRIPEHFFQETQIKGIILLQDSPEVICERINARDANKIDVHDIKLMQDEEQKYVKELNEKLKIEYVIITHECTGIKFKEKLREMGGDSSE